MYKLDRNKPIPTIQRSHKSWRYPLDEMEEGDSFLVPWLDDKPDTVVRRMRGAIDSAKKRHPTWKFTVRLSHEEKGVRIWRLEEAAEEDLKGPTPTEGGITELGEVAPSPAPIAVVREEPAHDYLTTTFGTTY